MSEDEENLYASFKVPEPKKKTLVIRSGMNESSLIRGLLTRLRSDFKDAVIIKHGDSFTSGVPDISFTWRGRTIWLEVKFANPRIIDRGVQAISMKRMGAAGICYYVIYTKNSTWIVRTNELEGWMENSVSNSQGINHALVSSFLQNRLVCSAQELWKAKILNNDEFERECR